MRVPRGRRSRRELDDRLDDLASGDAQVVPLEIDVPGAYVLRLPPWSARPVVAISTAMAMMRVVFMPMPFVLSR
jgi:hypothetical protein